jgi:hypothetical protein
MEICGKITGKRFDHWLHDKIRVGDYHDLPSFADYLANELNKAAGKKPLRNQQQVGIHVAGYHRWPDDVRRPTFYHVHNGHGHSEFEHQWHMVKGKPQLRSTSQKYVLSPRELFSRHDDVGQPLEQNAVIPPLSNATVDGVILPYEAGLAEVPRLKGDIVALALNSLKGRLCRKAI